MTGMNTLGSPEISDRQGRTVTIEVTGVCQQSVLKSGNYSVRVPYSQMSQALQTIHHQGGKVASVQLAGNPPAARDPSSNADDSGDRPTAAAKAAPKEKRASQRKRR